MAGAMAGTAILSCDLSQVLDTVTLTVNNSCNLSCPHCYLQYDNDRFGVITPETLDLVFESKFRHLALVGKEPLVNSTSISVSEMIAERAAKNSKTVSLITNGLNLSLVKSTFLSNLSYIDISLDGGPKTYRKYRKGSLIKLTKGLCYLYNQGFMNVNALHVLNTETLKYVDDMIEVTNFFDFQTIMFSPYVPTENHGFNSVKPLEYEQIFLTLSRSELFMNEPKAFVLLNLDNFLPLHSSPCIEELLEKYRLTKKVRIIKKDPLLYGIIRVTYDGFILTPYQSLNTRGYKSGLSVSKLKERTKLQDIYQIMRHDHISLNN